MEKVKLALVEAEQIADELIDIFTPWCRKIEKAGSIRRRSPLVGDIELVAMPVMALDMFGEATADHTLDTFDYSKLGKVIKSGHKYKKVDLDSGISLDLFIVTPPAEWGVVYMIRTGSADFSHKLVTPKKYGGMLPSDLRVKDGAIWKGEKKIPTPSEDDVFRVLGISPIPPEDR